MLRNVPRHKNCPPSTGKGTTSRKIVHAHAIAVHCRKQPPPREPRKVPAVPVNHPEGFVCAWCGVFHPWSEMAGFDRRLKFCADCVSLMDAIELSAAEGAR